MGDMFPTHITDSDYLDCYYRSKVRGDKWGFPAYRRHGQVLVSGTTTANITCCGEIWSQIGRRYKTRYVKDPLYVYHYGHRSLTGIHNLGNSARGYRMWNQFVLEHHLDFLKYGPIEFVRQGANLCRFSLHLGESAIGQIWSLKNLLVKVLRLITLAIGGVKFLSDMHSTRLRAHQVSDGALFRRPGGDRRRGRG